MLDYTTTFNRIFYVILCILTPEYPVKRKFFKLATIVVSSAKLLLKSICGTSRGSDFVILYSGMPFNVRGINLSKFVNTQF